MLSVMILYKINKCPVNAINRTDSDFIQITRTGRADAYLDYFKHCDQLPRWADKRKVRCRRINYKDHNCLRNRISGPFLMFACLSFHHPSQEPAFGLRVVVGMSPTWLSGKVKCCRLVSPFYGRTSRPRI